MILLILILYSLNLIATDKPANVSSDGKLVSHLVTLQKEKLKKIDHFSKESMNDICNSSFFQNHFFLGNKRLILGNAFLKCHSKHELKLTSNPDKKEFDACCILEIFKMCVKYSRKTNQKISLD